MRPSIEKQRKVMIFGCLITAALILMSQYKVLAFDVIHVPETRYIPTAEPTTIEMIETPSDSEFVSEPYELEPVSEVSELSTNDSA